MGNKLHIDFDKTPIRKNKFYHLFGSGKVIAVILVLLISAWMGSGLFISDVSSLEDLEAKNTEKVFIVSAQRVQNQDTYKVVRASGVLKPSIEVALFSKKDGEVINIMKSRGEALEEDEIILEIDKGTLVQELNAREANLRLQEKNFSIASNLSKKNLKSEFELLKAKANLTRAVADVAILEESLSNSYVKAGISGILDSLEVEEGQFVKKNQIIGKIMNVSKMLLFAPIAQTDVGRVLPNNEVVINVTGVGNQRGVVKRIASSASEATRTFLVEIEIDNLDNTLKSGMSAEVGILVEKVQAFSISPAHLAIGEDGSLKVKTVRNDIVFENDVFLVRTSGDFALVSGLQNDDIVLTSGQAFVSPGDKIKYKIN